MCETAERDRGVEITARAGGFIKERQPCFERLIDGAIGGAAQSAAVVVRIRESRNQKMASRGLDLRIDMSNAPVFHVDCYIFFPGAAAWLTQKHFRSNAGRHHADAPCCCRLPAASNQTDRPADQPPLND